MLTMSFVGIMRINRVLGGRKVSIGLNWNIYSTHGLSKMHCEDLAKTDGFLDACNISQRFPFETTLMVPHGGRDLNIFSKFWYIPFENDSEQRPWLPMLSNQHSSSEEDESSVIIRCYWQNRLVPWTVLQNLALFGDVQNFINTKKSISQRWRRRLVGILLLDWNFDEIANNKLRFKINLEVLLNDRCLDRGTRVSVRYSPLSAVARFAR
jgi:hypothetical protein